MRDYSWHVSGALEGKIVIEANAQYVNDIHKAVLEAIQFKSDTIIILKVENEDAGSKDRERLPPTG